MGVGISVRIYSIPQASIIYDCILDGRLVSDNRIPYHCGLSHTLLEIYEEMLKVFHRKD